MIEDGLGVEETRIRNGPSIVKIFYGINSVMRPDERARQVEAVRKELRDLGSASTSCSVDLDENTKELKIVVRGSPEL